MECIHVLGGAGTGENQWDAETKKTHIKVLMKLKSQGEGFKEGRVTSSIYHRDYITEPSSYHEFRLRRFLCPLAAGRTQDAVRHLKRPRRLAVEKESETQGTWLLLLSLNFRKRCTFSIWQIIIITVQHFIYQYLFYKLLREIVVI